MYKDIYKLEHVMEEGEITCWTEVGPFKEAQPGNGYLGRGLAG